jgi:hypothetical protein
MAKKSLKVASKAPMKRIHTQPDLSPRALVLACAEGLLGQLILNARLGFSDIATELPLHQTVQTIAAARGYHHHHEYPVLRTKVRGDHKRLDFVFARLVEIIEDGRRRQQLAEAVAVEMKVVGRSSENNAEPLSDGEIDAEERKDLKEVSKDLMKIGSFMKAVRSEMKGTNAHGYLIVVNLASNKGIRWDISTSNGIKKDDVKLVERFRYEKGNIKKSVTVYEVRG